MHKYVFIASDASLYATGAAIGNCRFRDSEISDIQISAFCSRKLDEQEILLSSRSRELIALATAIEQFSDILPREIQVLAFVDHKSLCEIRKNINVKGVGTTRVRKAFSRILDYPNLRIFYCPGESKIINVVEQLSKESDWRRIAIGYGLFLDF